MSALEWDARFENGLERMDETHREFVDMYNRLAAAPAEEFFAAMDAFIEHTEAHFAQENRWMEAVDFPGCHRAEHERVLAVMHDIRQRAARGDLFLGRRLVEELPAWFDNHTNGMDAALAFHLNSVGYDVETGAFADGQPRTGVGTACATLAQS